MIKELSSRQAELIIISSEPEIAEDILKNSFFESNIQILEVDFRSIQSIQHVCDRLLKSGLAIDVLVNSAEIINQPPELNEDQVEQTFQVNYLSQFLSTVKLLPLLKKSRDSRIINITSGTHRLVDRSPKKEFHQLYKDSTENRLQAYQYSKFCLTSFAWKLGDILSTPNVSVHCVDPGSYTTNPLKFLISKTPYEAIQGILFVILTDKKPGFYIEGIQESLNYNRLVSNQLLADILWTLSRKLCEKNLKSISI